MRSCSPQPVLVLFALSLGACGACNKKDEPAVSGAAAASAGTAPSSFPAAPGNAVAESLPRCRADGAAAAIEGEDVMVGDAATSPAGLLVGVVRRKGSARIASVLRAGPDLTNAKMIDVGPSFGDDPPPSPRWHDGVPFVALLVRKSPDAGPPSRATGGVRELRLAKLEDAELGAIVGVVAQQGDESMVDDVAWPKIPGPPLATWDEDAVIPQGKFLPDHGVIKVQALGKRDDREAKARIVSPDTSDAESPKLAARTGGGYWAVWLARRAEVEDAGFRVEGAGELRAFRWVEAIAIDGSGEPLPPVRRLSPEKGHAVSFDIVTGDPLVILVQDEGAAVEGGGSRIVRHALEGDRVASNELVDGGVGHALADLALAPEPPNSKGDAKADAKAASGWLTWTDTADHAWLAPASAAFAVTERPTAESALDGARVLAADGSGVLYVVSSNASEIRRFRCR